MIRVVIRKSLHSFLATKAQKMSVDDMGEVVNYLLLQIMEQGLEASSCQPTFEQPKLPKQTNDYADLSGFLT
jgi:uncharacterized protein YozE (UPF0346 family)